MGAVQVQDVGLIQSKLQEMMSLGYSGMQILSQVHTMVVYDVHIDIRRKLRLAEQLARCDRALTDGASEYLQVLSALVLAT